MTSPWKHIETCRLEGLNSEAATLLAERGDIWEIIYHARHKNGGYAMYNPDKARNPHNKRWARFDEKNFKIIETKHVQKQQTYGNI